MRQTERMRVTLGTHRVEADKHQRLEQPFGRDARAADIAAGRAQRAIHRAQSVIGHAFDGVERMVRWNQLFEVDLGVQVGLVGWSASHTRLLAPTTHAVY
ncbi:MAG: hypothetical protein J0L78_16145 [Planctomycetes bacterium]|nr:hypothetical protein [Planctomycetota bacterium]